MRALIAGFALGIAILQQQASLPGAWTLFFLLLAAILILGITFLQKTALHFAKAKLPLRFLSGMLLGFFWASVFALFYLQNTLDQALENKNITLIGTIDSLPTLREQSKSFDFAVEHAELEGQPVTVPPKILLSWNETFQPENSSLIPDLHPGERWRLNVQLKRPHSNANPYGFDYEARLLQQNIRATGYVKDDKKLDIKNRLLEPFVMTPGNLIDRARSQLREHIQQALPDGRYTGMITALVIGDQQGINASDWDIFNRTGISHLVSISGLHITLISSMFAALISLLWRYSFFTRMQLPVLFPAQKIAAIAGGAMAWFYVLLAGFGVPSQRTLYMLLVVAVAIWSGRITRVSYILFAALGVVLLYDPWAVQAPGFWLSFGAVGIILYISTGRKIILRQSDGRKARLLQALHTATHTQLAITIGLIPLTLLFFGRISIISPVANAVAIPLVGMVITPIALIGSILPSFLARYVLGIAHYFANLLAHFLEWISAFHFAVWTAPIPSFWFFLVALLGTIWMLAPRGWPVRWMGAVCWFPLVFSQPTHPPGGEVWATALDIGQGSAVLIETRNHRLLYDTGPAYSSETDAGERIIVPYLNARGIRLLDALVISHGDLDHAGGAASILGSTGIPVKQVYSSLKPDDPVVGMAQQHRLCLAGQAWEWDGVHFEMLGPTTDIYLVPENKNQSNAESCVLKVTAGSQSMLLAGDIGEKEEFDLLARVPEKLKSDILLVPHHGSKTSSSMPFLSTVKPAIALFQLGYLNRYGHPNDIVEARYQILDIKRMRTDKEGAITVTFGKKIKTESWRQEAAKYWYED